MTTLRVIAGAVLVCLSASQVASAGLAMQAKPVVLGQAICHRQEDSCPGD